MMDNNEHDDDVMSISSINYEESVINNQEFLVEDEGEDSEVLVEVECVEIGRIRKWSIENHIPHTALDGLLKILNERLLPESPGSHRVLKAISCEFRRDSAPSRAVDLPMRLFDSECTIETHQRPLLQDSAVTSEKQSDVVQLVQSLVNTQNLEILNNNLQVSKMGSNISKRSAAQPLKPPSKNTIKMPEKTTSRNPMLKLKNKTGVHSTKSLPTLWSKAPERGSSDAYTVIKERRSLSHLNTLQENVHSALSSVMSNVPSWKLTSARAIEKNKANSNTEPSAVDDEENSNHSKTKNQAVGKNNQTFDGNQNSSLDNSKDGHVSEEEYDDVSEDEDDGEGSEEDLDNEFAKNLYVCRINEVMASPEKLDEKIFIDYQGKDVKPELKSLSTTIFKTDSSVSKKKKSLKADTRRVKLTFLLKIQNVLSDLNEIKKKYLKKLKNNAITRRATARRAFVREVIIGARRSKVSTSWGKARIYTSHRSFECTRSHEKSNTVAITSITTEDGKRYKVPEDLMYMDVHEELKKTTTYTKVRANLKRRHDNMSVWFILNEELQGKYFDEAGNLEIAGRFLNEMENIEQIVKKVLETDRIETILADQYPGINSKEFKQFLEENEVKLIYTAVNAPFSNGLNERLNQTLRHCRCSHVDAALNEVFIFLIATVIKGYARRRTRQQNKRHSDHCPRLRYTYVIVCAHEVVAASSVGNFILTHTHTLQSSLGGLKRCPLRTQHYSSHGRELFNSRSTSFLQCLLLRMLGKVESERASQENGEVHRHVYTASTHSSGLRRQRQQKQLRARAPQRLLLRLLLCHRQARTTTTSTAATIAYDGDDDDDDARVCRREQRPTEGRENSRQSARCFAPIRFALSVLRARAPACTLTAPRVAAAAAAAAAASTCFCSSRLSNNNEDENRVLRCSGSLAREESSRVSRIHTSAVVSYISRGRFMHSAATAAATAVVAASAAASVDKKIFALLLKMCICTEREQCARARGNNQVSAVEILCAARVREIAPSSNENAIFSFVCTLDSAVAAAAVAVKKENMKKKKKESESIVYIWGRAMISSSSGKNFALAPLYPTPRHTLEATAKKNVDARVKNRLATSARAASLHSRLLLPVDVINREVFAPRYGCSAPGEQFIAKYSQRSRPELASRYFFHLFLTREERNAAFVINCLIIDPSKSHPTYTGYVFGEHSQNGNSHGSNPDIYMHHRLDRPVVYIRMRYDNTYVPIYVRACMLVVLVNVVLVPRVQCIYAGRRIEHTLDLAPVCVGIVQPPPRLPERPKLRIHSLVFGQSDGLKKIPSSPCALAASSSHTGHVLHDSALLLRDEQLLIVYIN
ncbi:unnamed protein product [Trichogramma brassicae]|uniref:Integrase catalytic domain-containing protein n=1 Tax=Trichogramma brassicae TaxID=86971 RepID=A0A6H5I0S2_9HYME|nr:unnamed protein product [Trichogramma brassicae]